MSVCNPSIRILGKISTTNWSGKKLWRRSVCKGFFRAFILLIRRVETGHFERSNFAVVSVKNNQPCPAESSGFKAVVVKNSLASCVECEEAPCPPNLPDLGLSWSRTTLPFVWVRISAVSDRNCRIEGCRGWTALPPLWDVKKAPAKTSGSEAVKIEDMSKSKAQPTIFHRSLSGGTPPNV